MRPLRIEFTGRQARIARHLAWGVLALFVLAALTLHVRWRAENSRLNEAKKVLEDRLAALEKPSLVPVTVAEPPWLREADATLRHDWNQLLGLLESIDLVGVRLQSLQAHSWPETTRLEYELDSWQRLAELTEALNQGSQSGHWTLLSVSAAQSGMSMNAAVGVRGVWERTLAPAAQDPDTQKKPGM